MEGRRERRGDGQRASGGRAAEGGRSFRPQPLGRSGQASNQAVAPQRMPTRNEPERPRGRSGRDGGLFNKRTIGDNATGRS